MPGNHVFSLGSCFESTGEIVCSTELYLIEGLKPSTYSPAPGPDELPLYLNGDEELTALAEEGSGAAQSLATQLSAVRRSHMACWSIAAANNSSGGNSSDAESGAAAGGAVTDNAEEERVEMEVGNNGTRGKQKVGEDGDTEAVAASEHGSCMGWWEGVLGRWHEKTQLVDPSLQKKFRVVNQGPWAQVTASLADRERANRRAFMTESEVRVEVKVCQS